MSDDKSHATAREAYCVKCKTKREMKDTHEVEMDNGRRALKGVCPVCGTNMTRFLPMNKGEKAEKPAKAEKSAKAEKAGKAEKAS